MLDYRFKICISLRDYTFKAVILLYLNEKHTQGCQKAQKLGITWNLTIQAKKPGI